MRCIRRGITRTVFLIGRWAVKVPSMRRYGDGLAGFLWSFCRGVLANQCEAQWTRNGVADEPICPVRWSLLGGVINVYPRCGPLPEDWAPPQAILLQLPIGDDKPDNYGLLAGRVVRLDYDVNYNGCPHDRGGVAVTRATFPDRRADL